MDIQILHLIEGAQAARGLTVIIDVFRAFSLECYAYGMGAEGIIPVGDIEHAYVLKEAHPDYILVGERNEQKPEGFDFGNSPVQILKADLKGKTIVHTTSSGTQGIVNAVHADEIITGSFVNAGAIVEYIQKKNPDRVSLVAMGYAGLYQVEEDTGCAEYIAAALQGRSIDFPGMVENIRKTSGARFFLPDKQHYAPGEDFDLCLNLNRFDFVLKVVASENHLEIKKLTL